VFVLIIQSEMQIIKYGYKASHYLLLADRHFQRILNRKYTLGNYVLSCKPMLALMRILY